MLMRTFQMPARRPRVCLLGCSLLCLCLLTLRQSGFVQPTEGGRIEVQRREIFRLGGAAAAVAGASPSFGDSGVTQPWGKRPDGSEDDFHTGGVEWEDIKVGTGATPKSGDLIAIEYKITAVVRERDIVVDDTKGKSTDFRFGVGQLIAGMDEGILGMKTGGERKLSIPGSLSFQERLPQVKGRIAVPAFTPLEAVVKLNFIPGSDEVYEFGADAGVE